jgi:hypothetical protein
MFVSIATANRSSGREPLVKTTYIQQMFPQEAAFETPAEHAIKTLARLRRAIEGLSTRKGIEEYLILLSICQRCKYSGLDFLDFLRSGESDIGAFAAIRENRTERQQVS